MEMRGGEKALGERAKVHELANKKQIQAHVEIAISL